MHWSDIQFRPSDKTLRQFAGIWIVFFGGIAAYQGYFRERTNLALTLGSIAAVVGLLGLAAPQAIRRIYVGWMVAAFPIGWAVSHLILALIFFGLFTPLAALFRLMGRDALHRKPSQGNDSYFVPKTTPVDPASYLRQY
jgi:Saxitoxin biosynthesis operon protein SxtJ